MYIYIQIDTAYGVFNNMKTQICSSISLRWNKIHENYSVQKLNTKISTQYLPYNMLIKTIEELKI